MPRTAPSSAVTLSSRLARLGWAALAALHAAIALRLTADDGGLAPHAGSVAALATTVVLFALKAADARFLRLPRRRHAAIAFLAATALVHHEAVVTPEVAAPVAVVAVLGGAEALRREAGPIARALRRLRDALAVAPLPRPAFVGFATTPVAPNARPTRGGSAAPARAPPFA